jgi:hypothetical protein
MNPAGIIRTKADKGGVGKKMKLGAFRLLTY